MSVLQLIENGTYRPSRHGDRLKEELGIATPDDERRWARQAGLPVDELRRRAKAQS